MASPQNLARKLIESHLLAGDMVPGREIQLIVDQVLLQDATSTLTMLALEAIGLDRVRVELCAQYVDHGLVQADFRNPDDHIYLQTAAQRFGAWYSPPGNGISHPVHMERFGVPGKFLLGADSHTPAAGSLGMLGIGAGSIEVATVLAGEPFFIAMPEIWGVRLTGELPDWVSAKDVILEMLRRHTVKGGIGRLVEYHGPGVAGLSAMDRHVIANMGTELGATASLFPSDGRTREFLEQNGRGDCWVELAADDGAAYDVTDEIDLSRLEPLIATPSSPDNVVPAATGGVRLFHNLFHQPLRIAVDGGPPDNRRGAPNRGGRKDDDHRASSDPRCLSRVFLDRVGGLLDDIGVGVAQARGGKKENAKT